MMKRLALIAAAALAVSPLPALAADGFVLVNGLDKALSNVAIRRTGTTAWQPLGPGVSPGAKSTMSFKDPDCAFDIKASVAGKDVVWSGVNLCEVRNVTLRYDASGTAWADYD